MPKFSQSNNRLFLNLYLEQVSQDRVNNNSRVSWRLTVSRSGNYYTYNEMGDSRLSLSLDGKQVHSNNPRWRTSGEEMNLASGHETLEHGSDGKKAVAFSATFVPNNGIHGTITVSGRLDLTDIPRSSGITVGFGTIGSPLSIKLTPQGSNLTHVLKYRWGSKSGEIARNVASSYSWIIPNDFANEIPNATSGTGTIVVETYSGNQLIGSQSADFSAKVPDSFRPSLTNISLEEGSSVVGRLFYPRPVFMQILSDIKVGFIGAQGSYGSSIAGYYAEIVGRNLSTTSNGGRLGMMNFHGKVTIRARVVDSRGRSSPNIERQVDVLEYFSPILSFQITRSGATSSTLTVSRNAEIAPLTVGSRQMNEMKLSFKVAPQGSSSFSQNNGSASGSWSSQSSLKASLANLAGTFPANQAFTVIGTLSDRFSRTEFSVTVSTESVVFSYDKDGRVGVGKPANSQLPVGSLDVAGDIYARGKAIQQTPLTNQWGGKLKNTNLNNIDEVWDVGYYYVSGQAVGNPVGKWGQLFIVNPDGNVTTERQPMQIFIPDDGSGTYTRVHNRSNKVGNWKPWIVSGLNQFYPVGSIFQSTDSTNPATFMGGDWEEYRLGTSSAVKAWRRTR